MIPAENHSKPTHAHVPLFVTFVNVLQIFKIHSAFLLHAIAKHDNDTTVKLQLHRSQRTSGLARFCSRDMHTSGFTRRYRNPSMDGCGPHNIHNMNTRDTPETNAESTTALQGLYRERFQEPAVPVAEHFGFTVFE